MNRQAIIRRLEKLEKKQDPAIRITVNERKDGLFEWIFDDGKIEIVTEAEFRKRGGIIVTWQDHLITKDERKA